MRYRWYVVEEIEKVVSRREEAGASWEQMQAKEGGVYLRTDAEVGADNWREAGIHSMFVSKKKKKISARHLAIPRQQ